MSTKPVLAVRPPASRNLEAFVSGQPLALSGPPPTADRLPPDASGGASAVECEPPPASGQPPPPSAERPAKMRGVVRRAGGEERARLTVYVSVETAAKLRRHCFDNGLELSEVVSRVVERHVAKL